MRGFDDFKKLFEYFLRVKNLLFNHGANLSKKFGVQKILFFEMSRIFLNIYSGGKYNFLKYLFSKFSYSGSKWSGLMSETLMALLRDSKVSLT